MTRDRMAYWRDRIARWQDDDQQGYDVAIGLLCELHADMAHALSEEPDGNPDPWILNCTKLIEREGWDCARCGHRHTGRTLANICIGCACPATAPDEPLADRAVAGTDA